MEQHLARSIGKYLYTQDISDSLISYIKSRRWFRRKSEVINKIVVRDYAILKEDPVELLTIIEIYYKNFKSDIYYLPLMVQSKIPDGKDYETILSVSFDSNQYNLYDAFSDIRFCANLLELIRKKKQVMSLNGVFTFSPMDILKKVDNKNSEDRIKLLSVEQSNTSINYNNNLIMKNYRNIEYGLNPDFEISYFLTKETDMKNIPSLLGYIEYQNQDKMTATAAVLQEFIANKGDCWSYTLIEIEQTLRTAMRNCCVRDNKEIENIIKSFSKQFLQEMYRLGEITGSFHKALSTNIPDEAFMAENITNDDLNHWHSVMVTSIDTILGKIMHNFSNYSEEIQKQVSVILDQKQVLVDLVSQVQELKNTNQKKIRVHGDYHLGQVLKTADDFVILDFEGEPIKTLEERRAKFLPQKDIAGMLRSFNYATCTCLYELPGIDGAELANLEVWSGIWEDLVKDAFLDGYLSVMKDELPPLDIFKNTVKAYQIDKAVYELDYEINNRPDWLKIPLGYLTKVVNQAN